MNTNPKGPIRLGLVDDNLSYREHLRALIGGAVGFCCVGAYGSAEEALINLPREKPHVTLVDLELPGMRGEALISELKRQLPETEILVLTVHNDPHRIFDALEAGATGYLVKPVSPAQILEAIAEVHGSGSPMSSQVARLLVKAFHARGRSKRQRETLSPREEEVLTLAARGLTTKEIAETLRLSPRTLGTHFYNICQKLHVRSRMQAVISYLDSPLKNSERRR